MGPAGVILVAVLSIPSTWTTVADYCGAPAKILYAVALQESGRTLAGRFQPYPWTLNIGGRPVYYPSREAMFKGLMAALQTDTLSVDIGPMQLNWKWHYRRIGSPWLATDPVNNARLGCQLLQELHAQTGSWKRAIGRYHSATPARAQHYYQGVQRQWLKL